MSGQHDADRPLPATKVSRTTPNLANAIHGWLINRVPVLIEYASAWVTGSQVWSLTCGEDPPNESDVDVFFTNQQEYTRFVTWLTQQESEPSTPKPKRESSREGIRIHTPHGWFDAWRADDNEDVFDMLATYPSASHAQCRVAYQPMRRALVTIANEKATADSEPEWCERQSVWWAQRSIRLAKSEAA